MPYIKKKDLDRLTLAGRMLSNLAFNLGQNDGPEDTKLTPRERKMMRESQQAWDKAIDEIRNKK